jgi:DNA-binding XRE family transcriptional regulator
MATLSESTRLISPPSRDPLGARRVAMKSSLEFPRGMPRRLLAVEHTKIRVLREQAGLTPQELADRVGVTYRVVVYWEEGRYVPEARNVRRLADALGCVTADLTGTPSGTDQFVFAAGVGVAL